MERERQKLDRQLDLAQEKSKKANIGQEVLEAKMKVKQSNLVLQRKLLNVITQSDHIKRLLLYLKAYLRYIKDSSINKGTPTGRDVFYGRFLCGKYRHFVSVKSMFQMAFNNIRMRIIYLF